MPETLKEMPKVSRPGRKPKHPYNEWFEAAEKNAGIKLVRGQDFDAQARTIRHNLYRTAKALGIDIETVAVNDGKTEGIALTVNTPTTKAKK
jgi:hypothetical protein